MKKHKQARISLSAETVRCLSTQQLRGAQGGARAMSNTDELAGCICITQLSCPTHGFCECTGTDW